MGQTVVGIFDTAASARKAITELTTKGFDESKIDVSPFNGDENIDVYNRGYEKEHEGVKGFFSSLFDVDNDAHHTEMYTEVGSRGSIVTIHTNNMADAERAAEILDNYGAVDVEDRHARYKMLNEGHDLDHVKTCDIDTVATVDTHVDAKVDADAIPIIEEKMEVGKRSVKTGGVRLRSRIIERPVEETLRLKEERVFVERKPVNRVATEADFNTFKEGVVQEEEYAEKAVVSKEAHVVEEVTLNKDVKYQEEKISDTVRETEVVEETVVDKTIHTDSTTLKNDKKNTL